MLNTSETQVKTHRPLYWERHACTGLDSRCLRTCVNTSWLRFNKPPRACEDYWSEFRHCKSFKNWFHHYYTYGTVPSCQQWKEDYHNCREWEKHRGTEAKEALRRSEKIRVAEQRNFIPVWQLRQEPPRDWHVPLNQEKPQDS
uniref:synaptic plasticity regulator PANTS isoform X1 n=1 Tax=Maylandia zebra TaxID=106582 RepID=UPI000D302EB5|nr:UPF0545 protein C22orf39 homolog isoform X1 [Maylandia zebra]